jgi:sortase A
MIRRSIRHVKPLLVTSSQARILRRGDPGGLGPAPTLRFVKRGERWGLRIGGTLFAVGLLLVCFVAYQLWGTALYESHAQDHLRSDLSATLHRPLPSSATPGAATHDARLPPLASRTAASTAEPATNTAVGLLSIPKIGLNDAIVEGVGEADLEQGPGHYPNTPLPGQPGNVAIAGHRTTYAHPFYNLNELAVGDPIYILTRQGLFRYKVVGTQVVAPSDVAVLTSTSNAPTLTLTTCNPRYSASTRMVVTADFDPGPGAGIGAGGSTVPATGPAKSKVALHAIPGDTLTGNTNSWWPGISWSALTLLVALAVWLVWRRMPRRLRWLTVLVGVPCVLLLLLTSFEHISLALPGSF